MKKLSVIPAVSVALAILLAPFGGSMAAAVFAAGEETAQLTDAEAKKELEKAESAIYQAIFEFEVSNDTTEEDMLHMALDVLPADSHVTVEVTELVIHRASTTVAGQLNVSYLLTCGTRTSTYSTAKTIPVVVTGDSVKIDEDRLVASQAVHAAAISNKTTKQNLLSIVQTAVKHGTKAAWRSDYKMVRATFEKQGLISGTMDLALNGEKRTLEVRIKIPMLVRKIPEDKLSVCREEWDILRLVNVERAKKGVLPLMMPSGLQTAGNTREKELAKKFSHTRPNGKKCTTAIPKSFKRTGAGENIAGVTGERKDMADSQRFMNLWMNSKGHRENILDGWYGYMGVGYYESPTTTAKWSVQVFTDRPGLKSWRTSSGRTNFDTADDMQKEYLIFTDANGVKSYMPLDTAYMTKTKIGYSMRVDYNMEVVLSIGKSNAGKEKQPVVNQTSFSKKPKAMKKGFVLYWKKAKSVSGYEVSYSTSSKFAKKTTKTKTIKKASQTKLTVSKLKAKKKYYVRIRAYKVVNGTKHYSKWSAKKSIVTKK